MAGIFAPVFIAANYAEQRYVIAANTTNVNAASLFSTRPAGTLFKIIINSGVYVYSTSTATPALDMSQFASGCRLLIINNGNILGMGGAGSTGGNVTGDGTATAGTAGLAGGDAIKMGTNDLVIDNTNGNVFGGGGGGGGGGAAGWDTADKVPFGYAADGSGGGGGQSGLTNSAGGAGPTPSFGDFKQAGAAGTAGTSSANGAGGASQTLATPGGSVNGGAGGSGGAPGAAGAAGSTGFITGAGASVTWTSGGGAAGAAGKAVALNSKAITWIAGNNGTQVKGAVS